MPRFPMIHLQLRHAPVFLAMCALMPVGCVSTDTHNKALTELSVAKTAAAQQAAELDALRKQSAAQAEQLTHQLANLQQSLDQESSQRKTAEAALAQLQTDIQQTRQRADALTQERETLAARADTLERDKGQLNSELVNVRNQIKELEEKMAAGSAMAQTEIAKLTQRAKELETETARVAQERERLRQEQSQLAASLEQERQRLKTEEAEKARLAQEQKQLAAYLEQERARLETDAEEKARLTKEQEQLRQERLQLTANLEQEREQLKAEAAEKARLERERAAKEEEIQRLTRTQEALSRSLKEEIEKGNVTIQRVRDQLTINMVDRVLFDSGQAVVKPAGVKVLKQVADVLKHVTDKHIRIEGHTDNIPISVKLQDKFKTNWELSTARATTVVRYLIDQGGVDRQALSAAGYADTRPVASNDSEEGRSSNRRIEIVLYPKDLQQITGALNANSATTN